MFSINKICGYSNYYVDDTQPPLKRHRDNPFSQKGFDINIKKIKEFIELYKHNHKIEMEEFDSMMEFFLQIEYQNPSLFDSKENRRALLNLVEDCSEFYWKLPNLLQEEDEFIKKLLEKYPEEYSYLSEKEKEKEEYASLFLKYFPEEYPSLSDALKNNEKIISTVMDADPSYYWFLPTPFQQKINYIELLLKEDPVEYLKLPENLQENEHLALLAIKYDPFIYHSLSEELQNKIGDQLLFDDIDRVSLPNERHSLSLCIRANPNLYKILSMEWKEDISIISIAMSCDPSLYWFLPKKLQEKQKYISILLKRLPDEFIKLPKKLRENEEVLFIRMRYQPLTYWDLPIALQKSKKFVLRLVKSSPNEYRYLEKKLRQNRGITIAAVRKDPSLYLSLSRELQQDENIAGIAVLQKPSLYHLLPREMKFNKKVVITLLNKSLESYKKIPFDASRESFRLRFFIQSIIGKDIYNFFSDRLQDEREWVRFLIENHPDAYITLSSKWKEDEETALVFATSSNNSYLELPLSVQQKPLVAYRSLLHNPNLYRFLPKPVWKNKKFILMVVRHPNEYQKLSNIWKKDVDITAMAARYNPELYKQFSKPLQQNRRVIRNLIEGSSLSFSILSTVSTQNQKIAEIAREEIGLIPFRRQFRK